MVLDTRTQIQKVVADLNSRLCLTVPNFPQSIMIELAAIDSGLASIRKVLLWSKELNSSLNDLKLACAVLQAVCSYFTEITTLIEEVGNEGKRTDISIWDDYASDMESRHGTNLARLLRDCQNFVECLDESLTQKDTEIRNSAPIRKRLESYKTKQRQVGEGLQGRLNALDETLYIREFQRDAVQPTQTRNTVKLQEIQSILQLYKLGELEEKPTLAHPSAIFNNAVCLVREDITKLEVDIMVNSSDTSFAGMGTLDRIVLAKGGPELKDAVKAFGVCEVGDVMTTAGYGLPAKHLLHVVPPEQYGKSTKDVLRKIYREILWKAVELRATSIAIPCIGTYSISYMSGVAHDKGPMFPWYSAYVTYAKVSCNSC
jgi:O-acetyl-ADP-ribose deacetylase (regulator of RNase III)